jgi:very-short-patch-repair endonuclease
LVEETVRILREVLAGDRDSSVGIVTFNAEQQALIENLLDEARRNDPRLEPFFSDDAVEPVLIKNLESVQGEERDVMLFSITYGPDQTGRVAMNFGPLNQAGGERRLNVAVTRAREELIIFSSIKPDQLDLSRTSAVGVAHLKKFLDFALHGSVAFARAATGPLGDFESPFEAAVAQHLASKGWTVHPQIGVSGFRVDLGIVDPDAAGSYLAGVECDGATYHRGATARDRDRLRQAVLEGLGWRILRIWSTDWWTNSTREAERVHAALQDALGEARAARPTVNSPPVKPSAPVGEATQPTEVTADPSAFYDDEYKPTIGAMIAAELAMTGPIRLDRLVQRIARAHGFQRAGREIQERVTASVPNDCARTRDNAGTFIWPAVAAPSAWSIFRKPAKGDARDPSDVPIEELVALAKSVSGDEASMLIAMRDACGLSKLRAVSRERFREAIAMSQSIELGPPHASGRKQS